MGRKLKLLVLATSMILVVSILATSVFAATSAAVSVTNTVSYTAIGVSGELTMQMRGVTPTAPTTPADLDYYDDFSISNDITSRWNVENSSINKTYGAFDNVTILIHVINTGPSVTMPVKITNLSVSANSNLQLGVPDNTYVEGDQSISAVQYKNNEGDAYQTKSADAGTSNYSFDALAANNGVEANTAGYYILITFSVTDHTLSNTSGADISFGLQLGHFPQD